MAFNKTFFIPKGYEATLTGDDFLTTGIYGRVAQPGSGTQYAPSTLSAGASATVGPFNEDRDYYVRGDNGNISYSLTYSGIFSSADGSAYATLASPTFTGTVVLPSTTSIGTVSSTEIGYLDNISSAIQTQLNTKAPITPSVVGAAETGITATEYGDDYQHTTVLTLDTVLPAIAGGADLGVGVLLYTLPAGAMVIDKAYMSVAITQTEDNITADTPEVGLGTVIASGAVAVLSGTATFENILTGQVAADCDGTASVKTVADQILVIESDSAHTIHLNVADGWAASGDVGALLTGTVVLHWQKMS